MVAWANITTRDIGTAHGACSDVWLLVRLLLILNRNKIGRHSAINVARPPIVYRQRKLGSRVGFPLLSYTAVTSARTVFNIPRAKILVNTHSALHFAPGDSRRIDQLII
jgi:hypothetical protein